MAGVMAELQNVLINTEVRDASSRGFVQRIGEIYIYFRGRGNTGDRLIKEKPPYTLA